MAAALKALFYGGFLHLSCYSENGPVQLVLRPVFALWNRFFWGRNRRPDALSGATSRVQHRLVAPVEVETGWTALLNLTCYAT